MAKKNIAPFLGTGTSLNTIGKSIYAFSGRVDVVNAYSTILEFTTGDNPYKTSMEFTVVSDSAAATTDDYLFVMQLNEDYVGAWVTNQSATISLLMVPITFIIPPLTHVKIQAYNITDSSSNQVYGWLYGKRLDA